MPSGFYVSIKRADDYRLLAGPYRTHGEALKNVPAFRDQAIELNPRHHFDAFGTCKLTGDQLPLGIFTPDQMSLF